MNIDSKSFAGCGNLAPSGCREPGQPLEKRNSAILRWGNSILAVLVVLVSLSGCAPSKNEIEGDHKKAYLDPDPGNRRLAALRKEPALELVPPGTRLRSHKIEPKKLGEVLSSNVGVGPSVTRIFAPKAEPINVEVTLNWFDQRLVEVGWARNHVEEALSRFSAPARIYRKQIDHWCARLHLITDATEAKEGEVVMSVSSAGSLYPERQETCVDYPSPSPLSPSPIAIAEFSS